MIKNNQTNLQQDNFGFETSVVDAFSFLLDYGYRCVQCEKTFVRYESEKIFFQIYHGRISKELGLEVGQISELRELENKFSLAELSELMGIQNSPGVYVPWTVYTVESVRKFVFQLADLVKKHLEDVLQNKQGVFERLQIIQTRNAKVLSNQMEMERRIPKADEAFREKMYYRVIELLEPIQTILTSAYLKKLEYSKKQITK
jgi:hypothetical protein